MNNKLKTALMTAGLSSVLALMSMPSMAAHHGESKGEMSHEMKQYDGEQDPKGSARMHARMGSIQSALNLKETQMAAWSAFEAAMKPASKADKQDRKQHKEAFKSMTTPERLDWMQSMKAKREAEMGQRAEAIKAFYAQLSPEQQKSFDEAFWSRHGHGGMGKHQSKDHHGDQQGQGKMK